MPFKGNPNAGAPDPAFLQFLFNRQDARAKAERQSQVDRQKTIASIADQRRKTEVHDLDIATKRAALLKSLNERGEGIASGVESLKGRLQPEDLSAPAPSVQTPLDAGQDFGSIMAQNDPAGVAAVPQNAQARDALSSEVSQLAQLRGQATGQGFDSAATSILGQGVLAQRGGEQEQGRELDKKLGQEGRDLDKTIAKERRQLATTIASERRASKTRISDARSTEKARREGTAQFAADLRVSNRGLRGDISKGKRNGLDTAAMEEELAFNEATLAKLRSGSSITVKNQIGEPTMLKLISKISSADAVINIAEDISSDMASGDIKLGSKGFVENFKQRAVGVASNWLTDDNTPEDVKSLIRDAMSSGKKTFKVSPYGDTSGKQLTLGLDQLVLAWGMIKSGRDSARFTLLELTKVLESLNFTKAFGTESEARTALAKVLDRAQRDKRTAMATMDFFGADPNQIAIGELTDEDMALQQRVMGARPPSATIPGADAPIQRGESGMIPGAEAGNLTDAQLDALQ
jgi:hypothetical protein